MDSASKGTTKSSNVVLYLAQPPLFYPLTTEWDVGFQGDGGGWVDRARFVEFQVSLRILDLRCALPSPNAIVSNGLSPCILASRNAWLSIPVLFPHLDVYAPATRVVFCLYVTLGNTSTKPKSSCFLPSGDSAYTTFT